MIKDYFFFLHDVISEIENHIKISKSILKGKILCFLVISYSLIKNHYFWNYSGLNFSSF